MSNKITNEAIISYLSPMSQPLQDEALGMRAWQDRMEALCAEDHGNQSWSQLVTGCLLQLQQGMRC